MKDAIPELDLHRGGVIVSTLCESVHFSEGKKREPMNSMSPHPEERTRKERPPLWRGIGVGPGGQQLTRAAISSSFY